MMNLWSDCIAVLHKVLPFFCHRVHRSHGFHVTFSGLSIFCSNRLQQHMWESHVGISEHHKLSCLLGCEYLHVSNSTLSYYLWSRHFTRLCKSVHPWGCVSEIQFIKGTELCQRSACLISHRCPSISWCHDRRNRWLLLFCPLELSYPTRNTQMQSHQWDTPLT